MARTEENIKQDYQTLCMVMGEKVNQIAILNKDVRHIQAQIKKLNSEMGSLLEAKKTEALAKKAEDLAEKLSKAEEAKNESASVKQS